MNAYRFEVYEGQAHAGGGNGLWYWRLVAANGNIVADSSEGYASKSNARRAARSLKNAVWRAEVG